MYEPISQVLDPNLILDHITIANRPGSMKVADLGCGASGFFVLPMAERIKDRGKVYAVDVVKDSLVSVENTARTAGLHNEIETIWADLEHPGATGLDENSIDLVMLINTLFQMDKPDVAMAETARILKPSGQVLVIDWGHQTGISGPPAENRIPINEFIKLATSIELKEGLRFKASPHHYGVIFEQ